MNIKKLELWYQKNHKEYPFRKTKEPYDIWVSEIMLQQTQMETVIPYYERFIRLYPNVKALAKADDDALKKAVEGIGYYRRFKLMKRAANIIVDVYDGSFPSAYEDIMALPGIGAYTAGAIMSIAYDQPFSAVDGNVIRIISRQYHIQEDMRLDKHKKQIDTINQKLIEKANPSVYTQALMDLGRNICTTHQPSCESCPINDTCLAYDLGIQSKIPFKSKLKPVKELSYIVLVIHTKQGVVLRKRSESLLEGMYEYPQYEAESLSYVLDLCEEKGIHLEIIDGPLEKKHTFTHQKWMMHVYECRLINDVMDDDWMVVDDNMIYQLPMAIAHRKIRRINR